MMFPNAHKGYMPFAPSYEQRKKEHERQRHKSDPSRHEATTTRIIIRQNGRHGHGTNVVSMPMLTENNHTKVNAKFMSLPNLGDTKENSPKEKSFMSSFLNLFSKKKKASSQESVVTSKSENGKGRGESSPILIPKDVHRTMNADLDITDSPTSTNSSPRKHSPNSGSPTGGSSYPPRPKRLRGESLRSRTYSAMEVITEEAEHGSTDALSIDPDADSPTSSLSLSPCDPIAEQQQSQQHCLEKSCGQK